MVYQTRAVTYEPDLTVDDAEYWQLCARLWQNPRLLQNREIIDLNLPRDVSFRRQIPIENILRPENLLYNATEFGQYVDNMYSVLWAGPPAAEDATSSEDEPPLVDTTAAPGPSFGLARCSHADPVDLNQPILDLNDSD